MKFLYNNSQNKINVGQWFMFVLLIVFGASIAQAQVRVPFTQRTSNLTNPPNQQIYTIKGDYRMIGNTNLTLETYGATTPNSNHNMVYVDEDGLTETINSSSAELTFSTENGADPNCSKVVFAGLYWTGRAHDGNNSPQTFIVNGTSGNFGNGSIINNAYTLTIESVSGPGSEPREHTATYTFTPTNGGDAVVFTFHTWRVMWGVWEEDEVTVKVGNGAPFILEGNLEHPGSVANGYLELRLDEVGTAYTINTGDVPIIINRLRKPKHNNDVNNTNFRVNVTYGGKVLNKRKVKLRYNNETYIDVTANATDIWYPDGQDADMYAAYADVTDFVRTKGLGTYTVADMALREGNGGGVGYYGGWALIVVYKNSKMKWRDVTIFDGYAFVEENANGDWQEHIIDVQGYKAAQNGDINVKIGIVAGEGDRGVGGTVDESDALYIQKEDNTWMALSHAENDVDNFFVSSIITQGTRTPNLYNNTGLDIVSINIDNTNNAVIGNNDTETKLRYGTSQDTYALVALAMSIDAFIPEASALNQVANITGGAPVTGPILPGEQITYTVEIKNQGTEAINNFVLDIPIPYTTTFVSCSATYHSILSPTPIQPAYNTSTNSIVWNIGTLPDPLTTPGIDQNTLLATMTYTLEVTEDCFILSNDNCTPKVELTGTSSGVGAKSGTSFANMPMIAGYQDAPCDNEPITDPLEVTIDNAAFIASNCNGGAGYQTRDLYFCVVGNANIPFEDVSTFFPLGCRFYDEFDTVNMEPTPTATEYTAATGFPSNQSGVYYAVPPGINNQCYWQFTINISSSIRVNRNVTRKL